MRLRIGLLLFLAAAAPCAPWAAEPPLAPATLARVLREKPPIPHPETPFVLVFFEGGDDSSRHGFAIDGTMTERDWATTLEHVGHLCPYSDFKGLSL